MATAAKVPAQKPSKTKAAAPAKDPVKLPKTLGECVDLMKSLAAERLLIEKQAAVFEAKEKFVKKYLIAEFLKTKSRGAVGKQYQALLINKEIPQIEDRAALQAYIKKTGDFDVLAKSLDASAVVERWEAGKAIPGVVRGTALTLSVTKIKA